MTSYLRSMGACGALVLGLSERRQRRARQAPGRGNPGVGAAQGGLGPGCAGTDGNSRGQTGGARTARRPRRCRDVAGRDEDPLKLLDEALAAMDEAAEELAGDTTTDKAVEHQEHAVEQLKKLLEAAQQSQSKQNQPQNSKKNSSGKGQPQDHSQGQDPQQFSSDPMGANGKRRQDDDKSGEASERVDGATQAADGTLGPGGKTNAVWGTCLPASRRRCFAR